MDVWVYAICVGGGYMRGYARLFWKGEFEGETFCVAFPDFFGPSKLRAHDLKV